MGFWGQFGRTLLLLAVILIPLFLFLNRSGVMIVKAGTYTGLAMGTPTTLRGEYRHLSGYVSKNFRISHKYSTLSIQMELFSGSADVEVTDPNGNILYNWRVFRPFEQEISCRDLKRCKVRIASRDFAGKFLVALQ